MYGGALLLEHQGKMLLRRHEIATPAGIVAEDDAGLMRALNDLPARLVLKAQIAAGGRGKAGGIMFADDRQGAIAAFSSLMGRTVNGHAVKSVLVEERVSFERERYAAIWIDGGEIRLLLARKGGIDIEETSAEDPSNFQSISIDPIEGPNSAQLQGCFSRLGYSAEYRAPFEDLARKLFALYRDCDAIMAEINPLVELSHGRLLALDARVIVDNAALDRQPMIAGMLSGGSDVQGMAESSGEVGASGYLNYRRNPAGGSIGLIGLGAGLNMTLMDWIASSGAKVAALVDIDDAVGSGHGEPGFSAALAEFDQDAAIRSILINVITCGYRLDDIVAALLQALGKRPAQKAKPVILHLRGNVMDKTPAMLVSAGWSNAASIREAIADVVELANR